MFDPPELKALIKVSQDWGRMAANHTMGHLTSEDYRDWINYNKTTLVQAFKTASGRVGEAKARAKAVKTVRLWVGDFMHQAGVHYDAQMTAFAAVERDFNAALDGK